MERQTQEQMQTQIQPQMQGQMQQQMPMQDQYNNKTEGRNRRQFIVIVLLLVMAISIGFANLSSTLRIRGNSTIKPMRWNIHFENISDSKNNATIVTPATIKGNTTDIEYEVQLHVPGSYYQFSVDVVNTGSIDAKLENLPTLTGISSEQDVYTNYTITYSDGSAMRVGDVITAGHSRKVTVRVELDPNITFDQLPTTEQQLNLGVDLDYIQAD